MITITDVSNETTSYWEVVDSTGKLESIILLMIQVTKVDMIVYVFYNKLSICIR